MNNITFSMEAMLGYAVEGLLVIAIPVLLIIFWIRRTKASMKPVVTGIIIFPVFGILLKLIPSYFLLIADNPVSRTINSNIWLYCIIGGGLLAGIFEEGGRFVAFKFILKKYKNNRDAISYGLGHGGFESAYVGISALSYIVMGIIVNNGGIAILTEGADAASTELALNQIKSLATTPFYIPAVFGTMERISAITFHTAMSVFVFAAAKENKYIMLFPAAILLHTLTNSLTVFVQNGTLTIPVLELIMLMYAFVMATFAFILYRKLGKEEKQKNL